MTMRAFVLALGLTSLPVLGWAQAAPVDPRWAPYLGCWQLQRVGGVAVVRLEGDVDDREAIQRAAEHGGDRVGPTTRRGQDA